jgi:multicomponent Na+:H+ antiporter subunit D
MTIALPLALPWIAAAGTALLGGRRRLAIGVALAVLAATVVALAVLLGQVLADGPRQIVAGSWPEEIGIALRADALGVVFALVSVTVVLAAFAYQVAAGVQSRVLPALVLFLSAGLTGLFLTSDVFNFYVFFELSMISAYVLSGYGDEARQVGAGFVFAVVNLLGSFVFLIGIAGLYHVTGTLDMAASAQQLSQSEPTAVVLIAITLFVAFGVKLGLFPFHFWLPPVYCSAEPGVAAILSGAVANIGSYGLLRFGGDLLPEELDLGATVLLVLGSASIVYGSLQALSRRTAPEVLAYSAIGQAGYVLLALAVGGPVGYAAAVLYSLVNALNKALLFLSVRLRGWLVGAAVAVGAFSVVGVPPTAGFLGKVEMFRVGISEDSVSLVALVFLGGAMSFVYMFQIYQHDFWRGQNEEPHAGPWLRVPGVLLAVLVVALGVWPEPLLAVSREAAETLTGGQAR